MSPAGPAELFDRYERMFPGCIVFSAAGEAPTVWNKYVQDKLFGACDRRRLNSGMYVGTAAAVASMWRRMAAGDDDQEYATRECRRRLVGARGDAAAKVEIDEGHALFYNVSSIPGELEVVGKRVRVVRTGGTPCVISAPNHQDLSGVLASLGIGPAPAPVHQDAAYRLSAYGRAFAIEIAAAVADVHILCLPLPATEPKSQ